MIVTKFVGRKEADRVGSWRLRYFYLRQINSHRCALCVTRKHQLSRSSPRSLSVFVPTVSLWQLVRPSLHSVSLSELPFHGGFYPVSTPITAIRHRWSSFCTWPTYLPLSPESFSRCRLRWTTPPSPQWYLEIYWIKGATDVSTRKATLKLYSEANLLKKKEKKKKSAILQGTHKKRITLKLLKTAVNIF